MRVGSTRFDPVVVGVAGFFGLLAIGLAYLLRDTLVQAPQTAFPLLFSVFVGGSLVVAWLIKRSGS